MKRHQQHPWPVFGVNTCLLWLQQWTEQTSRQRRCEDLAGGTAPLHLGKEAAPASRAPGRRAVGPGAGTGTPSAAGSVPAGGASGLPREQKACTAVLCLAKAWPPCLLPSLPPPAPEIISSVASLIPEPHSGGFFCFFVLMTVPSSWACHARLIPWLCGRQLG